VTDQSGAVVSGAAVRLESVQGGETRPVHAAMVGSPAFAAVALLAALGLTYLAIGGSWSFLARTVRGPAAPRRRAARRASESRPESAARPSVAR